MSFLCVYCGEPVGATHTCASGRRVGTDAAIGSDNADWPPVTQLTREVEAMRRVVEAAERWYDTLADLESDAEDALVDTVDEYRARRKG